MASNISQALRGGNTSPVTFDINRSPGADLSLVAHFNASLDHDVHKKDTEDPDLSFLNPPWSAFPQDDPGSIFNPALTPLLSEPYFQSIENAFTPNCNLEFQKDHFLSRRSISEPPDGFAFQHSRRVQHDLSSQQMPVTFHRNGQMLGMPARSSPKEKQSAKLKQSRAAPYPMRSERSATTSNSRYELRSTKIETASMGREPTSMPSSMMHLTSPAPIHHSSPEATFLQHSPALLPFITSRMCTPEAASVGESSQSSPASGLGLAIDPILLGRQSQAITSTTPSARSLGAGVDFQTSGSPVMLQLGAQELRAIIFESVQQALREENAKRAEGSTKDVGSGELAQEQPADEWHAGVTISGADDVDGESNSGSKEGGRVA